MKVSDAKIRKILNSRGEWGIELELKVNGNWFRASVPAGKSRGKYEAVQLRAEESIKRFSAFKNEILGEYGDFREFDAHLIKIAGERKEKFGVDLVLAASIAFFRAQGNVWEVLGTTPSLPTPMLNLINGGKHAGNWLSVQEFLIVPLHLHTFREKMEASAEIYKALREFLLKKYGRGSINVGDEGGFAPPLKTTSEAIELLERAVEEVGYGGDVRLSLDMAATSYFDGDYSIDGLKLARGAYIDYVLELVKEYRLFSVEDPLHEDDWEGFAQITKKSRIMVVGDDLLVTNPQRVRKAIEMKACNAVLVKPNQIGTVTETLEVIELAKKSGWNYIISHRSGETTDTFISHLAFGIGAPFIKAGAPCRGERTAKYNELLRLEELI